MITMLYWRVLATTERLKDLCLDGWKLSASDPLPWGSGRVRAVLVEKSVDRIDTIPPDKGETRWPNSET